MEASCTVLCCCGQRPKLVETTPQLCRELSHVVDRVQMHTRTDASLAPLIGEETHQGHEGQKEGHKAQTANAESCKALEARTEEPLDKDVV